MHKGITIARVYVRVGECFEEDGIKKVPCPKKGQP